jgi:type IV fimbrial biogenesis protein FimT
MEVLRVKGFTLIELTVSFAVLTIILSLGVPKFETLIEIHKRNIAISSLKRIMVQSRALALENEISITACPMQNGQCINNWEAPITIFYDLNNNLAIDTNEAIFQTTQMDLTTGYWQKKRANSPFIRFNPQGHAFSSATTFLYCPISTNLELARQLVISFQGRIRIDHYLTQSGAPYASLSPLACSAN